MNERKVYHTRPSHLSIFRSSIHAGMHSSRMLLFFPPPETDASTLPQKLPMDILQHHSNHRRATAMEWKTSITRGARAVRLSLISFKKKRSAFSSVRSNWNRSSTRAITPSGSAVGLLDRSSMPASLMRCSRFRTRPALLRNALKAWQDREQNWRYSTESKPPMPSTISRVRRKGGGNGFGSLPNMNPKSMWKKRPVVVMRMFSKCRSPTPSRYVMTQYPAQLRT
mmetsp:Transcript_17241/g.47751  ORF Transcript_17241/g.47751 Transcript_17241/m.47751 type:complete len:225 (+) Transcript_17241:2197-2871(+)